MLVTEPKGIDPRALLQVGENPLHLRHNLGYLMAYEWADVSPKGDWLGLVSRLQGENCGMHKGRFRCQLGVLVNCHSALLDGYSLSDSLFVIIQYPMIAPATPTLA